MQTILKDRTAVITGAESGIGAATALTFARNGAKVVLSYLNDETSVLQFLSELKQEGYQAFAIKTDVRDRAQVDNLFLQARKTFGSVSILVNSAGVRSKDKPLSELAFEEFQHTMETNLYGVFNCCKAFLSNPDELNASGRIINISSIHAEVVSAGKTDYCASKHALMGFSKALSLELATIGTTVNCIAPGMILTPMNQMALDDAAYRSQAEERIPLGYAAQPSAVADIALVLASDTSAYVTGTTMVVDGGLRLNRQAGAK